MKEFKDLEFTKHPIATEGHERYSGAKWARMKFDNRYGVSIIFGKCFYSNGIDTYELAVTYDEDLCYNTDITDDVLGYLSEKEVTETMIKIQNL